MFTKSSSVGSFFASFVFYSLGMFSSLSAEHSSDTTTGLLVAGSAFLLFGAFSYLASKDLCRLARHNEESVEKLRREMESEFLRRRPR